MTTSPGPALGASLSAAALGAIVLLVGLFASPAAVAMSFVVAYMATLAVVLGLLLLVMIAHLSGAVWFVVLRRQVEAGMGALPALAVLAIPLVMAEGALRPSFHPAPFITRAAAYVIAWTGVGEWLRRTQRRGVASAAGLAIVGLALTFASLDWMMLLSPEWSSTVYGPYYFAGAMVGALALVAILAGRLARARLQWSPTTEHFQALGRLTLAFVLFWAYLWYAQFFIIWIADIPREATWYFVRLRGGWEPVAALIVVAGGVVPFLVLAFRAARGSAIVMPLVGACLLIVHYLDVYWLLVPGARSAWTPAHLLWDAGALAFVAGTAMATAMFRAAESPAVPIGDPMLEESLQYEAH